jgi:hypothetical protein
VRSSRGRQPRARRGVRRNAFRARNIIREFLARVEPALAWLFGKLRRSTAGGRVRRGRADGEDDRSTVAAMTTPHARIARASAPSDGVARDSPGASLRGVRIASNPVETREIKNAGNAIGPRVGTHADFCSLAATLVAFTCAVARTVVWAATANIFVVCFGGLTCVCGCRNGDAQRGIGEPTLACCESPPAGAGGSRHASDQSESRVPPT